MNNVVLFDLDGTLIDSYESVLSAIEESLQSLSIQPPKELYYERAVGKLLHIAERHLPTNISNTFFRNLYDSVLSKKTLNGVKVNGKAEKLIAQIKLAGFSLCVLTNKKQSIAEVICNSLFTIGTFDAIIGRKSSEPIKPYQRVFDVLWNYNIQINKIQCLIGDSEDDRLTAELLGTEFYNIKALPPDKIVEVIFWKK